MKPLVPVVACTVLCAAIVGCGGSKIRVWRGPRVRSTGESIYAPPVEPPSEYEPRQTQPQPEMAPPVRPEDLQLPKTTLRLEQELPPPPAEQEEAVQFLIPVQPTPMPNALSPTESKPILEQSSGERRLRRDVSDETLGEGKIAMRMQGHSTYPARPSTTTSAPIQPIETAEQVSSKLMQVQYIPFLAPVPSR